MISDVVPQSVNGATLSVQSPRLVRVVIQATAFLISLITLIVYLPALTNGFVGLDDHRYVYENKNIQSIDYVFLKWMFTALISSNWHPLTLFSHAVDYALYGLKPWGHHLTNIILHAVNTGLVFILIFKLVNYNGLEKDRLDKKALISGVVAALLFGIHPLHVESVAWVSERKDVLCAFFYLLSVLAYFEYASINSRRYYVASLFLFVMALMSKPMAVSLPIVLLILDYCPLERLNARKGMKIFIEKAPFFLLSIMSSAVTLWAQGSTGAIGSLDAVPFISRILVAMRALIFYLYKMALPFNLAPFYPYPARIDFITPEYMGAFILLTAITIFSFKSSNLFLAVWSYYVVTLIPAIGIVQVGQQAAADRYTYLPSIGTFLLAGLLVAYIFERSGRKKNITMMAALTLIFGFNVCMTTKQIEMWRDSMTLWSREIKLLPNTAYMAYDCRGALYGEKGNYPLALKDIDTAIKIKPNYPKAYYNRGNTYLRMGRYDQAMNDFIISIKLDPDNAEAYVGRGNVFMNLTQYQQAIKDFDKAIDLDPEHPVAYYNRGIAYRRLNNNYQAVKDFGMAIQLKPQYAEAYNNRGNAHLNIGDYQAAIQDFNKALELDPKDAIVFNNRGIAHRNLGNYAQAIADFRSAIELNPAYATAHYNLGSAYSQTGNREEAFIHYRKAADLGFKLARDYFDKGT